MNNEKQWKLPHPSQVLECIEKWRNLDLRKEEDSEIDKKLSSFLDSLETFTVSSVKQNWFKLWRLRKFNYLIKDVSECWEPPAMNSTMGRCNAKGSPVLYVSVNLKTPFEELLIQPNEQVYLIMYKQIERLNLKRIISKDFKLTDKNGKPVYDDDSMLSYQILREFVRSEFLKPVRKGTEYLQRISAQSIWKSNGLVSYGSKTPLRRLRHQSSSTTRIAPFDSASVALFRNDLWLQSSYICPKSHNSEDSRKAQGIVSPLLLL